MDVDNENRDGFDTPTVVTLNVGEETKTFGQERVVEIVNHEHDERQGKDSDCYVDAMMDMEDVSCYAFDTPTVNPSVVDEEKQSGDQVHVGENLKHDERQGRDSGCSVDHVTMDMEDGNRDGIDMPTVFTLGVGEDKQSFAQPHGILKHYDRKQRESASSVDATMDMESENHAVFDARTVVPLDVGEEKQSLTQGEIFKNDEQWGIESSCSEDVKIHMERSEPEEEDNSSLNLDMEDNQLVESSIDSEDENYLSNKHPIFSVILAKSHVKRPYEMNIPDNFLPKLPQVTVPVVIRCGGRNWNMSCIKNGEKLMFCTRWRKFVNSNNLKIGDACVFELREFRETAMKFKVIILRNDLPPEVQGKMQSVGGTEEIPIELD